MSVWKAFYFSTYSMKHIAMFRMLPIGKVIAHLFLLVLITSLPAIVYTSLYITQVTSTVSELLPELKSSLVIEDGVLSSSSSETVARNGWTLQIDPGFNVEQNALDEKRIVFAKEDVYLFRNTATPPQVLSYNLVGGNITGEQLISYFKNDSISFWIMLTIFFSIYYLFVTFLTFIKVQIFAWFASLIGALMRKKIAFRFSYRIAAYALTIPTLLYMVFDLVQWTPPVLVGLTVQYGVYLTVILLALRKLPMKKNT